jgi:gliding motility-associated-like protein
MVGLKYIQRIILVLLFLLQASAFSVQALTANDDVGEITICNPRTVIVDILANDLNVCPSPIIRIVDYSGGLVATAPTITEDNKLRYEITCSFKETVTDAVKYSIQCGDVISTATVYITINQTAFGAGIEFLNSISSTCLKEGEVITHTGIVRNKCPNNEALDLALGLHFRNEGVVTLHEEAQITTTGAVTNIEHINTLPAQVINFTLGPGAELRVTTEYHITEIISGRYQTTIAELKGVSFNHFEKLYIPICPRELTVSSCDQEITVDVAIFCASSDPTYSIESGNATINANGILSYRPARVSTIENDIIVYRVVCGGNTVSEQINLKLHPCISESILSTDNSLCRQDSCQYNGPNLILINEVMIAPEKNNGSIYGEICDFPQETGGEWIELYNPNHCKPVDISGYILGNASTDDTGTACSRQRGIGARFIFPQGTRIPPMGFGVFRSKNAAPVDPSRLVENGGNTVEIIIDGFDSDNGATRFWLPDEGGWIGLYDRNRTPQDAVYWGPLGADICADCPPGVNLPSLDGFPANRKTKVLDFAIDKLTQSGNSIKRIPDGGSWAINALEQPTIGYCNEECETRFLNTDCNGTATVTVAPRGNETYSFLWNDSRAQATATATGLCEGTYCVTITDNSTLLTKTVCVEVEYKRNAPEITGLRPLLRSGKAVPFSIKNGTDPFTLVLNNNPPDTITSKREQILKDVPEGEHTLLVTDKNFCTDFVVFKVLPECLIIPDRFFTPNGDGENDVWAITNLDCYDSYRLSIYDRSGKLLRRYESNFTSWDGTYRGKRLPSTDYWFVLDIHDVDAEDNRSITGHFTLMR